MASGYSLHLGLSFVYDGIYPSSLPAVGSLADANEMVNLARKKGFHTQRLLNQEATTVAFTEWVQRYQTLANAGDIVLISFAGHGHRIYDYSGTETRDVEGKGYSEAWCLYDGLVLDDDLDMIRRGFNEDVRLLFVSASCYSGGMLKEAQKKPVFQVGNVLERSDLILPAPISKMLNYQLVVFGASYVEGNQGAHFTEEDINGGSGAFALLIAAAEEEQKAVGALKWEEDFERHDQQSFQRSLLDDSGIPVPLPPVGDGSQDRHAVSDSETEGGRVYLTPFTEALIRILNNMPEQKRSGIPPPKEVQYGTEIPHFDYFHLYLELMYDERSREDHSFTMRYRGNRKRSFLYQLPFSI